MSISISNYRNNSDYTSLIESYANRIILEKKITISNKFVSGKKMYCIYFLQPEWFVELDDDLKYNIITYLQSHYNNILKNIENDFDHYEDDDYGNSHNLDLNSKKRKLSEI